MGETNYGGDISGLENFIEYETNNGNDISGLADIVELYESSLIKKWIKTIPTNKTVPFEEYNRKQYFTPIADIVLDNYLFTSGKKQGIKKRNTLIQFIPTVTQNTFNKKMSGYIYSQLMI